MGVGFMAFPIFPLLFTAIGMVFTVLFVKEKLKGFTPLEVMLKSAASCFFIASGISGAAVGTVPAYGAMMVGGLVCGLMGDVWLDLKYVYPEHDEQYTFAGFLAFAFGHILFISGMVLRFGDITKPLFVIIPMILGLIGGIGTVLLGPAMKLKFGKFRSISMAYGFLLLSTAFVAGGLAIQHGFASITLDMMLIGGVMFAASDLVLSGTYFGEGKDRPIDYILNYAFYYGAQFVIAFSVFYS